MGLKSRSISLGTLCDDNADLQAPMQFSPTSSIDNHTKENNF